MQHQSCGSVRLSLYRPTIVALALFNFVSLGNISPSFASNEHVEFLEKGFSLSCYGIESFDFILEAGQLVGEWCRAQNAQLGERGCGEESDMCLEEFIRADRPGYSLSIAVGAAYMNEDISHSGSDIVYGNSRWVRSTDRNRLAQPSADYTWSSDLSEKRLQVLFSLGVEFPLGKRTVVRKTCVNPLASTYVELLTNNTLQSNSVIQKFAHNCNFAKSF